MREIRWREEYPKMPEHMKSHLNRVIEQERKEKITTDGNVKGYKKKAYRRIAVAALVCIFVLSVTGMALATMEDGSLAHLVKLDFQEGKDFYDIGNVTEEDNTHGKETGEQPVDESSDREETQEIAEAPEQFELDMEQYGILLNNTYQGDGFSIILKGIITDGYNGKLYYQIQMEDTALGDDYEWWGEDMIYAEDGLLISTSADTLLNKNGSSYNCVEFSGTEGSLYGTTITLKMDYIIGILLNPSATKESQVRYDCELKMQIPIEQRSDMWEKTYEVQEQADFGLDGDGYIETITVTPLGIYLNCSSYQSKENKGEYPWVNKVTFKDGTVMDTLDSVGFNDTTCQGHMLFGYPVDPDNVESLQLGEYIYTFE